MIMMGSTEVGILATAFVFETLEKGFRYKNLEEKNEWSRNARFLLQRGSAPWLCRTICLQAASDSEAIQINNLWLLRFGPWLCSRCLASACQSLGPLKNGGSVLGIDLKKVKVPHVYCDSRVQTVSADVMDLPRNKLKAMSPKERGFSVILSDMCPSVSGITTRDATLSVELGMQAVNLAIGEAALRRGDDVVNGKDGVDDSTSVVDYDGLLQKGGHLVLKLLESEDTQEFSRMLKPLFRKASWLRPKATRSSSREIYLICQSLQARK